MIDPTEHLGLVYHIANRYFQGDEDAVGYGFIGLMKAAKNFDPDRGYQFSTYAFKAIKQSMGRGLENHGTYPLKIKKTGRDKYVKRKVLQDANFGVLISPKEPELDTSLVWEFLGQLDDRTRKIFIDRYWKNMKMREIGDKYGIRKQRVSQILQKAIDDYRNR